MWEGLAGFPPVSGKPGKCREFDFDIQGLKKVGILLKSGICGEAAQSLKENFKSMFKVVRG